MPTDREPSLNVSAERCAARLQLCDRACRRHDPLPLLRATRSGVAAAAS